MAAPNEAIRQLYTLREKHLHRIAQINAALAELNQDLELDELIGIGLPRATDLRTAVLDVLTANAGEAVELGDLYTGAIDRGWRSISDNPRNAFASALSRLAQSGDIEKAARGRYRLPVPVAV